MATPQPNFRWSLEIVQGREPGKVYPVSPGETVVGSAPGSSSTLDLADQETSSTRRMAARQATLTCSPSEITIRDLDTPGGTFVNRQRLLSGQTRRLASGDLIQLGALQLKVAGSPVELASSQQTRTGKTTAAPRPSSPASPAAPPVRSAAPDPPAPVAVARPPERVATAAPTGRLAMAFSTPGGLSCKSWNDFLVLAAQHWVPLREELTSGRLGEYLRRIGRADLVPARDGEHDPDARLDNWLAKIPADQSTAPELDVYPESLSIRAPGGGGLVRQSVRITNVGYRLLRSTARVEPADAAWVRLKPEHRRPFSTVDQTDLTIELELPESIPGTLSAVVVIESNGGTKRLTVKVERPAREPDFAISASASMGNSPAAAGKLMRELVAPWGLLARTVVLAGGAIAARGLVMLVNKLSYGGAFSPAETRLISVLFVLSGLGVFLGLRMGLRFGEARDLPASGLAGAILGLPAAAIGFAGIQTVEGLLGSWASSILAVGILWAFLGGVAAWLSLLWIPHSANDPEGAR